MSTSSRTRVRENILLVDDDADFVNEARLILRSHNIASVTVLTDSTKVMKELTRQHYSAIFLDWVMPGLSGADLLPEIIRQYPHIPVTVMTGVNDVATIVSCIKQGAHDYLTKPVDATRLVSVARSAFKVGMLAAQNRQLTGYLLGKPLHDPSVFSDFTTCNERMLAIFKLIELMAPSQEPILITGETGTGKELVAQAIHKASGLKGAFVPINAAGLDDTVFTDTLFGHKKGAFTGAQDNRAGMIEQAKGGTIFLDEIGDLSQASQIKLLRLIQQNEYYRLGSDVLHHSDARIVAASNKNFDEMIAAGTFRSDVYYRLSTHILQIPPLRERREDILPLCMKFCVETADRLGKKVPSFTPPLRTALQSYGWPGNIRELSNKIGNAVTCNLNGSLSLAEFPGLEPSDGQHKRLLRQIDGGQLALHRIFMEFPTLHEVEGLLIQEAVEAMKGNKSAAAELLGISRPTLLKRLAELQETPETIENKAT